MISFIQTFGILLIIITLISFIVKLLKQPIIVGYVISGVVFAIFFAKESKVYEQVAIFSAIGITFLLFLMGLEFDLKSLKYLGKDIIITALMQSTIFFLIAFGLSSLFGFALIERVYLSVIFMFSSTLIAAKWLADKKEIDSLHGKIILGTSIIQDVIALIVLTTMSVFNESSFTKILLIPLGGVLLILLAFIFARFILNYPLKVASRYPELLFIMSLSVCFIFVEIASWLGYSTTIGAFIGGIVLANTIFRVDLVSKLKPLVTFFNMLFFVGLGFQLNFSMSHNTIIFLILLILLTIFLKPIVIYITLRARGYDPKNSFISGIYLSPLSEFAIIIISAGITIGIVPVSLGSITLMSVIFTMVLSSYLIKRDKAIFRSCQKLLLRFDNKLLIKDVPMEKSEIDCNILFFGYYEISKELLSKLKELNKKLVVIENDPENLALLRHEGIRCIYSSVNDPEFFEHINFEHVELVVSSLTDVDDNKLIIRKIKKNNPKAVIIVAAKHLKESIDLYNHEADYVLYSSYLNEQKVSVLLEEYTADINKLLEKKVAEMARLKEKEDKIISSRGKNYPRRGIFSRKAKPGSPQETATSRQEGKGGLGREDNKYGFFDVRRMLRKNSSQSSPGSSSHGSSDKKGKDGDEGKNNGSGMNSG